MRLAPCIALAFATCCCATCCAATSAAAASDDGAVAGVGAARLLVLEPHAVNAGKGDTALVQRLLAQEASRAKGLAVMSSADLAQIAALAGTQASSGCDDAGCMSEIAAALGAELVMFSELGKLGDVVVLQLSLYDAKKQAVLARETVQARDVRELALAPAVHRVLQPLVDDGRATFPGASPLRIAGYTAIAAGSAAFVVGAGGLVVAAVVVPSPAYATSLRTDLQRGAPLLAAAAAAGLVIGGAGALVVALAPE